MADVSVKETIIAKTEIPACEAVEKNGIEVSGQNQLGDVITMLNGCVAWNGIEAKLPTGANMPPQVDVLKLIKSWDVLDAEEDAGFRTMKAADLKPGDAIIGCKANNNSIDRIIKTYGMDAFRFIAAGGQQFGVPQWIAQFGTNPFEVLAIMRKNAGKGASFKVGGN